VRRVEGLAKSEGPASETGKGEPPDPKRIVPAWGGLRYSREKERKRAARI